MDIGSSVKLSGISLSNPLISGAYINSKTLEDIEILSKSSCGAIVVGSISLKPRSQNTGHGYWRHKERFYSLNSYGMPNGGMPYFKQKLPTIAKVAHANHKVLIANLVGFTPEEFIELIKLAQDSGVDLVELNLSCPNVWDDGKQKVILSYYPDLINELLKKILLTKPRIGIGLKLSPLPPNLLVEVSKIIAKSKTVKFVTATNSYPNALTSTGTKVEDEVIFAGLTGRALKPISLGMVKQLRALLPSSIDVVGCGGVSTANDVTDYLSVGATAVQIATALIEEGPSIFDKILFQGTTRF